MRTFTIPQIKAHFKGELYIECPEFIGHLVRNKILIKISMNQYTYDLTKLNRTTITEIQMNIKYKHLTLKR